MVRVHTDPLVGDFHWTRDCDSCRGKVYGFWKDRYGQEYCSQTTHHAVEYRSIDDIPDEVTQAVHDDLLPRRDGTPIPAFTRAEIKRLREACPEPEMVTAHDIEYERIFGEDDFPVKVPTNDTSSNNDIDMSTKPDSEKTDRELPDEQQPDGDLDGSEMVPYDRAQELEEQFADIVERTIDDTTVKGKVKTIDTTKESGSFAVQIDIPAEADPEVFYFAKPRVNTEQYDIVRWFHKYGYSLGDFSGMIEKNVEVDVIIEDDGYELVVPPKPPEYQSDAERPLREPVAAGLARALELTAGGFASAMWASAVIFIAPLGSLVIASGTEPGDEVKEENYTKFILLTVLGLALYGYLFSQFAVPLLPF